MHLNPMENLLAVLHATGKAICIEQATQLQSNMEKSKRFDLHLRNAGLAPQDIHLIASALTELATQNDHNLLSLSMSYNDQMSDQAAIELISALPDTLRELGMVGCALSDITANHLIKWAKDAPSLKMLCVEDNHFSNQQRQNIKGLSKGRAFSIYA